MSEDAATPTGTAVDAFLIHLERAGWGRNLSDEVLYTVAHTALELGLDPLLRDLWVTDEDEICITVAGLAKMAFRAGIVDGFVPEAVSEARTADDVAVWRGILHVKGAAQPIVEIAQAGGSEEKNPVAREYPNETARTKARGRCLKAAMGIGLPLWEELQGQPKRIAQAARGRSRTQAAASSGRGPAPAFADDGAIERFRKLAGGAGLDARGQLELLRQEGRRVNRSFEVRREQEGFNLKRVPRALMSSAIAKLEKEKNGKRQRGHAATSDAS